jgi:uncharacterized zinc-type alcohol dehydrogenase-like protein
MKKTNSSKLMIQGFAAKKAGAPIAPWSFPQKDLKPKDILIQVEYCGICHSDIHQARDEWGGANFPMVPGHEIVGKVVALGNAVRGFKIGQTVGVGCLVESCQKCSPCNDHEEQFCEKGPAFSYNSTWMDRKTPTFGGYASHVVVHSDFALKIAPNQPLERIAPLLCAGITTYSPLKRHGVKSGQRVGVVGLGGLGHMAVKIARAMGAEVTVFSTSKSKKKSALTLGAKHFVITRSEKEFQDYCSKHGQTFDLILDTVSAVHDINAYAGLLKKDCSLVLVGVPTEPLALQSFSVIGGRKKITGSLIGGIQETQDMLDFCAKKKIFADVEVISPAQINQAFERTLQGDVHYRFVIDLGNAKAHE